MSRFCTSDMRHEAKLRSGKCLFCEMQPGGALPSYDFLDQRKHVVMMPRRYHPSGGRTFKVTLTHQGLGSWHCVCCRQNRTAGEQPGLPGILTVCVNFFPPRQSRAWLAGGGRRRALGMSCIPTARTGGTERHGGGLLPEFMLYQVVRYCSMGPTVAS